MKYTDSSHKLVTLADIAARSGYSKATVSYALNGREGVSERARMQILELAESLEYVKPGCRRDPPLQRNLVIGAVISHTEPDGSINYFISALLAGVEADCRRAGVALEVATWDAWSTVGAVHDDAVSGFAYLGGTFPADVLASARNPSVLVGTDFPGWAYDAVLADNYLGAYLATKHLFGQGRLRLGMINGPTTTRTSQSKLAGFHGALADSASATEVGVEVREFSFESGYDAARRFFSKYRKPPDGLFVADDPMALGACRALSDLGIAVPEEVGVVGYGNSPAGAIARPAISTVEVFQSHLGSLGARLLLDRLSGASGPHQVILVAPALLARGSSIVQDEEPAGLSSARQGQTARGLATFPTPRFSSPSDPVGRDV